MISYGTIPLAPMVPPLTSSRPMAVMASRKRSAISGHVTKFMGKLNRTNAPCAWRPVCVLDVMRNVLEV